MYSVLRRKARKDLRNNVSSTISTVKRTKKAVDPPNSGNKLSKLLFPAIAKQMMNLSWDSYKSGWAGQEDSYLTRLSVCKT